MQVEILDVFGNDLMVINSARVSYGKSKEVFDSNDEKLIKYLVEHKHIAPFRHPQVQFRITCPIYVARQLEKHQTGMSLNSISGRYVDFSDSYTTIKEWRKQSKSSKQGSEGIIEEQLECEIIERDVIDFCKDAYVKLLEKGVSKEQARSVLPLSLNTTFIWTGSLLSFIHLFNLRLKPDSQQETRELVKQIYDLILNIEGNPFKYTMNNFKINQ